MPLPALALALAATLLPTLATPRPAAALPDRTPPRIAGASHDHAVSVATAVTLAELAAPAMAAGRPEEGVAPPATRTVLVARADDPADRCTTPCARPGRQRR